MSKHTNTSTSSIRIYVACLASYNNGTVHGAWIDADQSADDIQAEIATMLRASKYPNVTVPCPNCDGADTSTWPHPCAICQGRKEVPSAEEWAIHDFWGFCGIKISESHDIDEVAALAELITEHQGDADLIKAAIDVSDYGATADDIRATLEDKYCGCFDNLADWAESLCEDVDGGALKDLPSFIRYHIDWEAVAERELIMSGDYSSVNINGSHYIFNNNA